MPSINKFSFSDIIKSGSIIELKAPADYSSTNINYSLIESDSVLSILLLGDYNNLECNELYECTDSEIGGLIGENAFNNITLDKSIILYPGTKNVYCKEYIEADEYNPETEEWDYVTDETKLNVLRNFVPRLSYDSTNGIVTIKNISELYNAGFQPRELAAFLVHKRTRVPRGRKILPGEKRVSRGTKNTVLQEIFSKVYSASASGANAEFTTKKSFAVIESGKRKSSDNTSGFNISDTGVVGKITNNVNDFYSAMTKVIYERSYVAQRDNAKYRFIKTSGIADDNDRTIFDMFRYVPYQFYGVIVGLKSHKRWMKYDKSSPTELSLSKTPEYRTKFRECYYNIETKSVDVTRLCSYASVDAITVFRYDDGTTDNLEVSLREYTGTNTPYYKGSKSTDELNWPPETMSSALKLQS